MLAKMKSGKIIKGRLAEIFVSRNLAKAVKEEKTLTAKEVAELISIADKIEDLKEFENDERQVVKSAYNKKIKELTVK